MTALWHHDLALLAIWAGLACILGIAIAFTDRADLCVDAVLWMIPAAPHLWRDMHVAELTLALWKAERLPCA